MIGLIPLTNLAMVYQKLVLLSMSRIPQFTTILEKEGNGYVALCLELDIASQGNSIEESKSNLKEAIELFFEHAFNNEIYQRLNKIA